MGLKTLSLERFSGLRKYARLTSSVHMWYKWIVMNATSRCIDNIYTIHLQSLWVSCLRAWIFRCHFSPLPRILPFIIHRLCKGAVWPLQPCAHHVHTLWYFLADTTLNTPLFRRPLRYLSIASSILGDDTQRS